MTIPFQSPGRRWFATLSFYNRRRLHSTSDGKIPETAYLNLNRSLLATAAFKTAEISLKKTGFLSNCAEPLLGVHFVHP
jgi:hypothetical protein